MKQFFIKAYQYIFSKEFERTIPNRTRYLLINTVRVIKIDYSLGSDGVFQVLEFVTKEEALSHLDEHVAKSEREDWKLYKNIKLLA